MEKIQNCTYAIFFVKSSRSLNFVMIPVKLHEIFSSFRLAALKKNGEENWKKKVPKVEISTSVSRKTSSIIENNAKNINNDNNGNGDHDELSPVTLREKKSSVNRPGGKVGSLQVKLKIFMFLKCKLLKTRRAQVIYHFWP